MNGYIQVYTGNGKGKTTASIGLCIRAAGSGKKVLIAQFIKKGEYSEIKALQYFNDLVTIKQYGLGSFIKKKPTDEEIAVSEKGLKEIKKILATNEYDVVILDEANVAVTCGLFTIKRLLDIVDAKRNNVELVITGRGASEELIKRADLVTEMKEIKHYFQKGVTAREGIEK